MDVESVPTEPVAVELAPHDVRAEVTKCVLRRFGTALGTLQRCEASETFWAVSSDAYQFLINYSFGADETESHFQLDPIRICRFRAEELLRAASNQASVATLDWTAGSTLISVLSMLTRARLALIFKGMGLPGLYGVLAGQRAGGHNRGA